MAGALRKILRLGEYEWIIAVKLCKWVALDLKKFKCIIIIHIKTLWFMKDTGTPVSISGRIAAEDFQFLMDQPLAGKVTVSEKLRHVCAFYREFHESMSSQGECLMKLEQLLRETRGKLQEQESEHGMHSQLMSQLLTSIPLIMSQLIAAQSSLEKADSPEALLKLEAALYQKLLTLLETVLRFGLTQHSPTYNPKLVRKDLSTVLELVDLYRQNQ